MKTVIAVVAILVLLGLASQMDYEDEVEHHELYCSMVNKWKSEAARGVPEHDRTGWPPYDGECHDDQ